MIRRILITGAGGGGSNNLIESLRQSRLNMKNYHLIGSNIKPVILAKSPLDENYLLPFSTEDNYVEELKRLVQKKKIDLIIPNNDREVAKISQIRDQIPCIVFLPPEDTISLCQDKQVMYEHLRKVGIPMAKSIELKSFNDIEWAIREINGERFWIRLRKGSGSKGATWVRNADQAKAWIDLWGSLRDFDVTKFTISEFLPGRDYAFQSVWKDGRVVVAKMCERLEYFFGENRLSGMSSTPAVARTLRDDKALATIFKAIETICDKPHGNFNFDLKGRENGEMCITECNIGRFCMITPIFDRTGKYNTAEFYVRSAFEDNDILIDDPIDIAEGYYLLRDIDTSPTIVHEERLNELMRIKI